MHYALFDTDLGTCAIAWTPRGIRRLCLPEKNTQALEARIGDATKHAPENQIRRAIDLVKYHLGGNPKRFEGVRLDFDGTPPFHRAVYRALRRIPSGATISYGELASKAGSPGAARAVGQAMAKNPLPVIVPCHRVLAAKGKPGGFSAYGGTVTKARLLALEGVGLFESELPFLR
ncbi:MAG TPA: methylated-DNA--[protein]-cysteine S-methyltransferase [Polyangiaceae bacterium]|jgi:methylated-DNA-[protein]-cysteine S-methyltransferase|nr:methylated-DNA--[protein]-cysteine S-methyltransferase [Polyangiaceae bacterium]